MSLNATIKAIDYCKANGIPEYFDEEDSITMRLPSSSRPDLYHIVTVGNGGMTVRCTCEAHKNRRDCWHVALGRMIYQGSQPWITKTLEEYVQEHQVSVTWPTISDRSDDVQSEGAAGSNH